MNVPSGRKKTLLNSVGLLDSHTLISMDDANSPAPGVCVMLHCWEAGCLNVLEEMLSTAM